MVQTRRDFVWTGASGVGLAWLSAVLPGIAAAACDARRDREGGTFSILAPDEVRELEAIAARILPGDATDPGAREAGVIHFIDRAFETFQAGALPGARQGLEALQARVRASHPDRGTFSALSDEAQDAVLREIESDPFFGLMRFLTVTGMFAMPSYGGNRDELGWRLLEFVNRASWAPPFGHYDREAHDA